MKRGFLTLTFILTAHLLSAQVYYLKSEYGFAGGGANYFGDLNQEYNFKRASYSAGIFYRYNFSDYIALRIGFNYAEVGADDKNSRNYYQNLRNLNFTSNIYEATVQADFHFFRYAIGDFDHRFTPYVTIGAGAFYYNPYTYYQQKKYFLRDLGTEGQFLPQYADRKYGNFAMTVPIGAGIKFWMSRGITFGFEICEHLTTTDYLDDVSRTYVGIDKFPQNNEPYPTPASQLQDRSGELNAIKLGEEGRQRGISSTRDQYIFAQLSLSFRFPTYQCPDSR